MCQTVQGTEMWNIKFNGAEGSLYQYKKQFSLLSSQDIAVNGESYES